MFELLGLVLEALGLVIIFGSQIAFWLRVRKEWRSLHKGFLALTTPRKEWEYAAARLMTENEVKTFFKSFPLAKFLYDDFVITVVGLAVSLSGILLQFAC